MPYQNVSVSQDNLITMRTDRELTVENVKL